MYDKEPSLQNTDWSDNNLFQKIKYCCPCIVHRHGTPQTISLIVYEHGIDMEFVFKLCSHDKQIMLALTLIFNRTLLCGSNEIAKWLQVRYLSVLPCGSLYKELNHNAISGDSFIDKQ